MRGPGNEEAKIRELLTEREGEVALFPGLLSLPHAGERAWVQGLELG